MNFWLGLCNSKDLERTAVPACVNYGRLRGRKKLPVPLGPVFLDSRGFSEIRDHGCYTFSGREYADFVRRCRDEWGEKLVHASIMDWMCEPEMIVGNPAKGVKGTRLTVAVHQQLTVNSWVYLRSIADDLPWVPVIQGYTVGEYHECVDLYERHTTTRLAELPLVGLGSVCRRQGMAEAGGIVRSLYARGLKNLHGFGFKITGLVGRETCARYLASADSMAWSRAGRWAGQGLANSLSYALSWRSELLRRVDRTTRFGTQQLLW